MKVSRNQRAQSTTRRFLIPGLVFVGMVVAVISSLGAPLIPAVATGDQVSLSAAQWSLTVSLLVSAAVTPAGLAGWVFLELRPAHPPVDCGCCTCGAC